MDAHASEIAAATLEHSERIRLLTGTVERQGRSIRRLGAYLGALVILQGFIVFRDLVSGTGGRWWTDQLRTVSLILLISCAAGGTASYVASRRARTA